MVDTKVIMRQIHEGLVVLHEGEIRYRDLKRHSLLNLSSNETPAEHSHRGTLTHFGHDS